MCETDDDVDGSVDDMFETDDSFHGSVDMFGS